jgi:hypothetical protein
MKIRELKAFEIWFFLIVVFIYSCTEISKEDSVKTEDIQLDCERRNWTESIRISIGEGFVERDSLKNFWPLSPEARNKVFTSKDKKTYIIIKYCEYHYEGGTPLSIIAKDFLAKIRDTDATKLSSNLDSAAFISEHIVYNASFGHEVYLATKIIKIRTDIITIFGMNVEYSSDSNNRKLYSIIESAKII